MISKNLDSLTNYLWNASNQKITDLLTETNMNISDYYYLIAISSMEHPNFGDVAKTLHLTKPAISALIKRLMRNELIEKIQCTDDKRIFYLSLTEKGKKLITNDPQLFSYLEEQLSHKLTESQMNAFDDLLNLVVTLLPESNAI